MNLFFAELNILAVSIIGVLLVVVVPEIMLNVMSRTGKRTQTARRFDGMIPLVGALTNQDLRRTYKLLWF